MREDRTDPNRIAAKKAAIEAGTIDPKSKVGVAAKIAAAEGKK